MTTLPSLLPSLLSLTLLAFLPADGKWRRLLDLAFSLLLLLSLLLPLREASLPSFSFTPAEGESERLPLSLCEEALEEHLTERFRLPEGSITLALEGEIADGTLILRRATVHVSRRGEAGDIKGLIHYLEEHTGAVITAVYEGDFHEGS